MTFADDRRAPHLAGHAPRRWFMERGVKPKAGDHGQPWPHVIEQIDRGEAGVANADDAPVRQPERRLDQDLPAPIGELLVLAFARPVLLPIPLRGGQDGQERKCPATPGPGNLRQQHKRKPAQAARLDEVAMRGADRISVDAACLDLRSPAPFNGVVKADHDRFIAGDEGVDE